jgi:hypothetical protein
MMTPRDPIYADHRQFANLFPAHPDHDTSGLAAPQAFATWADVTGVAMAA